MVVVLPLRKTRIICIGERKWQAGALLVGRMHEVSHQKNNLDCHAPFGRSQGRVDIIAWRNRGKKMTSRSSPWAKNVWSKPPEKQSGLPRSLRSLARTGGDYCLKKNDVLRRADPSASRKTTFWDKRTPPLQEKRRFGTSGPLRFPITKRKLQNL